MSTLYEVYLKDENGLRDTLVEGLTSITATFRSNEPIKWKFEGSGLEPCPLAEGADIAVFRNGTILFCGYVCEIATTYDASTRIYDWEIEGLSDLGKLSRRLIYPIPSVTPPDPDEMYSATGKLSVVLLDLIKKNAANSALAGRRIPWLSVSAQTEIGDTVNIETEPVELLKYIRDKLNDTDLVIREVWDMAAGSWDILVRNPQDISDKVIFSTDNGSLSAWERTIKAPKANWLLVTGCQKPINENDPDSEEDTMTAVVMDNASISKWGRIEAVISRGDIRRDKDGGESWAFVAQRLQAAAYEELEKASAQFGYKLTTTEIPRNVFPEDYDIGDIVAVRIGTDEFTAKVDEIKVTYSEGVETIEPSVGTQQRGELQSVFTELGTLKEQIKVLQQSR